MGYRACTWSGPARRRKARSGAGGDRLVAGEAVDDADLVALRFAGDDHAQARGVVVDGEELVGIGGLVADDGVARHEDGVFAAGQQDARGGEHAGPQFALGIVEPGLEDEDARVGIHRRVHGGHLAGEIAVG